jgi:hypothetical protein
MVEYEHWQQKTSQTFGRRAVGCNLVVLKRAPPQSGCKIQAPFSATRRASNSRCLVLYLWSKDAMRVILC